MGILKYQKIKGVVEMKKIINGKLYNTETAELITEWENGFTYNDFSYVSETLYQTKKGAYFIFYIGGAMSKYAKHYGQTTSGSKGIKLLTEEEAKAWVMEHLEADEYIKLFGEVEEG